MRRSAPRACRAVSAPAVVHEGDVADEGDRRGAVQRQRRAPSTPRRRCRWRLGWRGPWPVGPPNHSRSRTGIDEATTSCASAGQVPGDRAGDARFGECAVTVEHVVDGRLRPGVGRCPAVLPGGVRRAAARAPAVEGTRTHVRRHVVIRVDGAGPTDLHEHGPGAGAIRHPLGQHLGGGRPADPHDQLRPVGVDERLVTEQRVEGVIATVQLAAPAMSDRPARASAWPRRAWRRSAADPATPAGEDHATNGASSRRERTRCRGSGDRRLRRPARGQRAWSPDERLAERHVEVDRAGGRERRTRGGPASATCGRAAASATPGSWNQRTARPNRWVWSIVCGAPTSRSSGGRSAVTTSSGTSEAPASTTAGMEVGRRRAARATAGPHGIPSRPSPRATKAADRSSCTTWTASSGRSARANAIGVLRDPGATTAARTPRADHSSTRVAQNVAWAWASCLRHGWDDTAPDVYDAVAGDGRDRSGS